MFNWLYKKYFQLFCGVKFGKRTKILFPCNLYNCVIDDDAFISRFVEVQNDCYIGKRTRISSHTFIAAGSCIGNDVFIAHGVFLCNDKNPQANNKDWKIEPVTIQQDSFVGSGSVINAGCVIYKGGKLGCGSLLTKNIGVDELWYGSPAKKRDGNDNKIGFK